MADSVEVLLRKVDEGVEEVRAHYEADLRAQELSEDLLYAVRQVVQDCQSALDWTATAVKKKYGKGEWRPYFPLTMDEERFPAEMEKQIKGLAAKRPNVAAAFERHQPYQPDKAELGYLRALRRVNTHEDFTPQTRTEQPATRYEFPGGAVIEMTGGASIQMSGGADIVGGGRSIRDIKPRQIVYVDWRFSDPRVSVLGTLEALTRLTRAAVEDIRREAQL